MKLRLFFTVILLSLAGTGIARQTVSLIPQPNSIEYRKGSYATTQPVRLIAVSDEAQRLAALFNGWSEQTTGKTYPVVKEMKLQPGDVLFNLLTEEKGESYRIVVEKNKVLLEGSAAGMVRGLSTLLQLFYHARENKNRIPALILHDAPKFNYRGAHLDVCRHFVSKEFVKRYIDLLALHKMNTFHWHLTDDQGWRIEIKKYPKLTEIGGWRNGSMVGPYRDQKFDTVRYGGYYTQEEIREVVAYATERHINVIPEIEMPGHAVAALAAYPEYSCTGVVKGVERGWGVFEDVFCVKDSTINFLQDILSEVIQLFPSKYIHIGGDECPKERWKVCPNCQAIKQANNLKDEHELQSYFIRRIEKYLNAQGRQIIGWDEILEGGLAPNATVMSWRGIDGGIAAARSGHDAIMTPGSHCYFDHYQGERATEPLAFGGFTPLEKVYRYRPIPDSLTAEQGKHILGAQCNLWSEYMYESKQVEYMLLPRLCALSEILWTDTNKLEEQNFYQRLMRHQRLLDGFRVNYSTTWMRPMVKVEGAKEIPGLKISLATKFPQKTEYAIDNGNGVPTFRKYKKPFDLHSNATVLVRSDADSMKKTFRYPYVFSMSTGAKVELIVPGDRSYANPGSTLTDGNTGVYPWTGKHWIGWYGKNGEFRIDLSKEQHIDSIVVYYLHDPVSWIHAPKSVQLKTNNGTKSTAAIPVDQAINKAVITVNANEQFLNLLIESIGKNPEGSAGAGDDGWMFVSEVQVY